MMLQINLKDTFEDFIWIIKVLDSSTSEDQMECVKNCFYLWEKKHLSQVNSVQDARSLNRLRGYFWAKFKNKIFNK